MGGLCQNADGFCLVVAGLQASNSDWYKALTCGLTVEQRNEIQEILKLAEQRQAAAGH